MSDPVPTGSEPGRWAKPGCVTIRCREDGPLVIELPADAADPPEVRVIDQAGGEFQLPGGKRAVALCRCGASGTKPFCDGSHRAVGFRAGERAKDHQ
jgi:CDGSH iron-sulfur domain-containing protein 3